jgi:hypothetical protein
VDSSVKRSDVANAEESAPTVALELPNLLLALDRGYRPAAAAAARFQQRDWQNSSEVPQQAAEVSQRKVSAAALAAEGWEAVQQAAAASSSRSSSETGPAPAAKAIIHGVHVDIAAIKTAFAAIKDPRKRAFLAAYSLLPQIRKAANYAQIDFSCVRRWRNDPEFVAAMSQAEDLYVLHAEGEAWRRAVEGETVPVFGSLGSDPDTGKPLGTGVVGTKIERSDNLLTFMLRAAKPDKYRERVEHSGPGGGPLPVQILIPHNDRDLPPVTAVESELVTSDEELVTPEDNS